VDTLSFFKEFGISDQKDTEFCLIVTLFVFVLLQSHANIAIHIRILFTFEDHLEIQQEAEQVFYSIRCFGITGDGENGLEKSIGICFHKGKRRESP
jgi:hypothetical protein